MASLESLMAALDTLYGFRVFILLSGEDPSGRGATSISVWQSQELTGLLRKLLANAPKRGKGRSKSPT